LFVGIIRYFVLTNYAGYRYRMLCKVIDNRWKDTICRKEIILHN